MKLMQKINYMPALLLSLLILSLNASQSAGKIYSVNGHQIEVTLVPDKSTIMLGEPAYLAFIVQNHSDQDLQVLVGGDNENALGRPESFTVTVMGEDNTSVPQPNAGMRFGGIVGPQKISAKKSYIFKLFLPHWANFEKAGTYSIVVKRTLKFIKSTPGKWSYGEKTTNVQAQAVTKIEVVPLNREKMAEVIAASDDLMLSYIQDERVIPYFIKALETKDYDKKFTALGALAKFDNDAAFQALKNGMETKGEDIENTATKEVANQLAENIRNAAAAALSRSPHSGAIPFLLSNRNDTSEGVRITILHVLGKMNPAEAIPILQEMTHDKSQRVSDEAKRYLKLLSTQK